MGKRAYGSVLKSFRHEVETVFQAAADEFGFEGPEYDDVVIRSMVYVAGGLQYRVSLNHREMTVGTRVAAEVGGVRLVSDIDDLALAAGIESPNSVPRSARSLHDLQGSLRSQAELVRQLQPLLSGANEIEMLRRAGAREWRIR